MADKEATVYVVDVGRSMGEKHNGRNETDLDWAMRYVWDKITSAVATERKTACLGVLGLRTDGSRNELDEEDSFKHITVLQEIGQLLLPDLNALRQNIRLSKTNEGDAVSAIVVAIQMITRYTKKLKYIRRIILVTDARGSIEEDGIEDITLKIKNEGIELMVVGVDFDDLEYGFKEEGKSFQKAKNEGFFKMLTDSCNGIFGTLQQAVEELEVPRLKSTRPTPSYKGQLTLGDPAQYDSALCIDVERYPRIMIRRPLSASNFVQRSDPSNEPNKMNAGDPQVAPNNLTSVRSTRTYKVADETAPGGTKDVDREDLAKGYEYGRTAVHISESDENVTKLETQAGLEIIGFIPWSSYERYMSMSVSSLIIGEKLNTKATMALSSLIHALYELESYVVARLVPKNNKNPVIALLAPSIEADYECLLDVQLPFAEDVRSYRFPPLDRVVTMSGKIITAHRNLPTDALSSAMSDYVDSMDLSTFGKDDEGNPAEYMQMSETYSPVLHRIDQAVRWRAAHPNKPIPPPYEILIRYSKPPEELVIGAKRKLEELVVASDVKKVPPKVKGRKRNRNEVKPVSGLNVEALLHSDPGKKNEITPQNAIPDFKRMLDNVEDTSGIQDAVAQFGGIIETRIKDSFGDINYGRAIEEINAMRDEIIDIDEPAAYNDFVRSLKKKMLAGDLGGDRREMWYEIKKAGLGLVASKDLESSAVSAEEARECCQFLSSK